MILNLMWGKCYKKEVYEYKRVEKQVFWRIHDYYCMLKMARLESVCVPLSGKRPTNMAQECTFILNSPMLYICRVNH